MITEFQNELQTLCDTLYKRKFFNSDNNMIEKYEMLEKSLFQSYACSLFRASYILLKTKTRKREVLKARQLCMWYEKLALPRKALAQIGFEYGGKDHATVLHAVRAINNHIETRDPDFFPLIEQFVTYTKIKVNL